MIQLAKFIISNLLNYFNILLNNLIIYYYQIYYRTEVIGHRQTSKRGEIDIGKVIYNRHYSSPLTACR